MTAIGRRGIMLREVEAIDHPRSWAKRFFSEDLRLSKITVIVPTLNEEENIDLLLERIFRVRRSCSLNFEVLFVDSASKDATCEKVRA